MQFFCKSRKKFVGIKIMLYICSKFFTSMTKRNCFLLFWALIAVCNYGYAGSHRVASYNIRIITSADSLERSWVQRKTIIAAMLKEDIQPDVIGLQEVSENQEKDLAELIGDTYSICSCNFSAGPIVMYRTAKYDCVDHGIFYLSPTPNQAVKGWDALYVRMSVWVKLRDKKTHDTFVFCSTHLDLTSLSITEGARVNVEQLAKIADGCTCILVGDMNSEPTDSAHSIYRSYFQDARFTCKGKVKDSDYTFFEGMNPDAQGKRIDYIYVRNGRVRHYRTIKNTYLRQWLPSDHIPVVCEVRRIFGMHKLF